MSILKVSSFRPYGKKTTEGQITQKIGKERENYQKNEEIFGRNAHTNAEA